MAWDHPTGKRHRVLVAGRTVRRVDAQRVTLPSRFAGARTQRERLATVAEALRAAAAPGAHQMDQAAADREVQAAVSLMKGLLASLHAAQVNAAKSVLADPEAKTEQRRRAEAMLRRVDAQKAALAARCTVATTGPGDDADRERRHGDTLRGRYWPHVDALRAAAASARSAEQRATADRLLEAAITDLRAGAERLHEAQLKAARKTLQTEERRSGDDAAGTSAA